VRADAHDAPAALSGKPMPFWIWLSLASIQYSRLCAV
jgi:hypothetical protein